MVQTGRTTLLVDCGFTMKETIARLHHLGLTPGDIDAVLLTHEHGDHVKGVGPLSRKFALPIWCTYGTYRQTRDNRFTSVRLFHAHEPFAIGDCEVDPFPTPHDAAESCQFVFSAGNTRFASVTDLGVCTPHVVQKLEKINGLVIECNYDRDMLANGPYPASLQTRIRSNYGHLGNEQAGELLRQIDHPELQCILLGHLSEQNNSDAVAMTTVHGFLDTALERVHVLAQHRCSPWFDVVNNQAREHDSTSRHATSKETSVSPAVAVSA